MGIALDKLVTLGKAGQDKLLSLHNETPMHPETLDILVDADSGILRGKPLEQRFEGFDAYEVQHNDPESIAYFKSPLGIKKIARQKEFLGKQLGLDPSKVTTDMIYKAGETQKLDALYTLMGRPKDANGNEWTPGPINYSPSIEGGIQLGSKKNPLGLKVQTQGVGKDYFGRDLTLAADSTGKPLTDRFDTPQRNTDFGNEYVPTNKQAAITDAIIAGSNPSGTDLTNILKAAGSGTLNTFSKGAQLLGKGGELLGKGISSLGDMQEKYDTKYTTSGSSMDTLGKLFTKGSKAAGSYISDEAEQIQAEQAQARKTGMFDRVAGYNPEVVRKMGSKFADEVQKGEYYKAVKSVASNPEGMATAFVQSAPEMIAMWTGVGFGIMATANANAAVQDLENSAKAQGRDATIGEKAVATGVSVISTYLDRLGDKLSVGAYNKVGAPIRESLVATIKAMTPEVKSAVLQTFGSSLSKLGMTAGELGLKAGVEGGTEYLQTIGEGKASDVNKLNFNLTDKEHREGLEAFGVGMGAGGFGAAVTSPKQISTALGAAYDLATIPLKAIGADKGMTAIKDKFKQPTEVGTSNETAIQEQESAGVVNPENVTPVKKTPRSPEVIMAELDDDISKVNAITDVPEEVKNEKLKELHDTKSRWNDVNKVMTNKTLHKQYKQELESEDTSDERKTYLTDILTKADSRLKYNATPKDLPSALTKLDEEKGTTYLQEYKDASNIVNLAVKNAGIGNAAPIQTMADVLKAHHTISTLRDITGQQHTKPRSGSEDTAYKQYAGVLKDYVTNDINTNVINYDNKSIEEKTDAITNSIKLWMTQNGGVPEEKVNEYMPAMLQPMAELLVESKSFGSEGYVPPGAKVDNTDAGFVPPGARKNANEPIVGLDLDDDTFEMENIPGIPAKEVKEQPKEKPTKQEYAKKVGQKVQEKIAKQKETIDVEDISTDTHSGLTSRTIIKMAETFRVPAAKVKAQFDIAFEKQLLVKKMGSVSKESNKKQYEIYFGGKGILPTYIKMRKAIQEADSDTATEAVDTLIEEYINKTYAVNIATRSGKEVLDVLKNVTEDMTLKDIGNIKIDGVKLKKYVIGVQGETGSDIRGTLTGLDYAKLSPHVSTAIKEQIVFSDSGHVLDAQIETANHLKQLLTREGFELPKVTINVRSKAELYNLSASKMKETKALLDEVQTQLDSMPKEELNPEEFKILATITKKAKVLTSELQKHESDMKGNLEKGLKNSEQYNNTTFKTSDVVSPDMKNKYGQEIGTVTSTEASKLGLSAEDVEVKEFTPTIAANELQDLLKQITELKKARVAEVVKINESTEVLRAHDKVIAQLEKTMDKLDINSISGKAIKESAETAVKSDRLVVKMMDNLDRLKVKAKELVQAKAFLDKNEEVFKDVTVNADKLISVRTAYDEWLKSLNNKVPSVVERNTKIRELLKTDTILEDMLQGLNNIAKMGVVLARKLLNLDPREGSNNPLTNELNRVIDDTTKTINKTKQSIIKQKVLTKTKVAETLSSIKSNPGVIELAQGQVKSILTSATARRNLVKAVRKAKKVPIKRIKEIDVKLEELKEKVKSSRLLTSKLQSNLAEIGKSITDDSDVLLQSIKGMKISGSLLIGLNLNALKTGFEKGSEETVYLDKVAKEAVIGKEGLFNFKENDKFNSSISKKTMYTEVLKQNPALALVATITNVGEGGHFEYNQDVLNAVMLVTKNYLNENAGDLSYNDDLAISNIIKASEYDRDVIAKARPVIKNIGLLLNTVASRVGDDIARAFGISQGEMGDIAYRNLIADLGNTGLVMAAKNGIVEVEELTASQWNPVASKSQQMDEKSKAKVRFVKYIADSKEKKKVLSKKERTETLIKHAKESSTLNKIDELLNVFDTQSMYRTYTTHAVANGKKYKIKGSPFNMPEKSENVLRHLEDQVYIVQTDVLDQLVKEYNENRDRTLSKAGWIDLETMVNDLQDDRDSQEGRNREIEDTMAKLADMHQALVNKEITEEIFFNWFFTTNGRYNIAAVGINPQADKHFTRFLVIPEQSSNREWDMDDKLDVMLMNDAIAQAFGEDIDSNTSESIEKFSNKIMKLYIVDPKAFNEAVTKGTLEIDGKLVKIPHYAHALLAIKFMEAKGSKQQFIGTLVAEYDAKSSGPMLKLMQAPILDEGNTFGDVSKEWLSKGAIVSGQTSDEWYAAEHVGDKDMVDAYQTITEEAAVIVKDKIDTGIARMSKNDKMLHDYTELLSTSASVVKPLVTENGKATKDGRTLGKGAFIPFGYAASTSSIKRNIGITLTYDVLRVIAKEASTKEIKEVHKNFMNVLNLTKEAFKKLQYDLRNTPTRDVRIDKLNGTGSFKPSKDADGNLFEMLSEMFVHVHGEAYGEAMENTFANQVAMNETIKQVTQAMFRMWKIMYDKAVAEEGKDITTERKEEIIRSLEDYFPLIKAPWSQGKEDSIAVFDTKKAPLDSKGQLTKTTTMTDGKMSSSSVSAMITEMEETFAAGAVLPIHWLDATIIGGVLLRGGIQGVHDALVLGLKGKDTVAAVHDMNKAMYDINKNYNMLDELYMSFLNMMDKVDKETLVEFVELNKVDEEGVAEELSARKTAIDLAMLNEDLSKLTTAVRAARNAMYSQPMTVGNVVGFKGMEFKTSEDELKAYDELDDMINKMIEECSK